MYVCMFMRVSTCVYMGLYMCRYMLMYTHVLKCAYASSSDTVHNMYFECRVFISFFYVCMIIQEIYGTLMHSIYSIYLLLLTRNV